jgi:DNA-binding transcriptional ArsR family regulator
VSNTRAPEILINSKARWAAMASPLRIQIVDRLDMLGTAAVPAIAALLGRRPDSLYHHFRILERAGIIRSDGWERAGSHNQALYRVAGDVRFPYPSMSGRAAAPMVAVTSAVLRNAHRGLAAALTKGGLRESGPEKDFWCRVHTARLSPADLAKVNSHLAQADAVLASAHERPGGRTITLTLCLWPSAQLRSETANGKTPKTRRAAAKDQSGTPRRVQEGNS